MSRSIGFVEEDAIKKAMDVFWRKGYNGATMRDLTSAMGINASSLYRSIGDKHQLFVKCIKSYTDGRKEDAKKLAIKQESPIDALVSFINMTVNEIIGGEDSCLAIKTTFEVAATHPDIQKLVKADYDFNQYFVLCILRKATELGQISSDIDVDTMTDHIISAFTGWHEAFILHQDAERIKKMAQLLISQIRR